MEKKGNKGRIVSAALPVSVITLGIDVLSLTGYVAAGSPALSIVCPDCTSTRQPSLGELTVDFRCFSQADMAHSFSAWWENKQ